MAIATDIEVTWINTIDSTNKIGLSKPLNQLGVNVFDDADFCLGYQNKALKLTKESNSYPHSTDAGADNVPFFLLNGVGYTKNTFNEPDGVYYRTILLAVPNGFNWGWESNLRADNTEVRIVTKLDLQKNKLYLTTDETAKNVITTTDYYLVNESLSGTDAYGNFVVGDITYHIRCADIYLTENGYYIKFQGFIDNIYDNWNPTYGEGVSVNFNYDTDSSMMYSVSPVWFANTGWTIAIDGSGNPNTYYIQNWNNTELDIAPEPNNTDIKFFATYHLYSPYYWRASLRYSVEYALWIAASYGLLFEWNGVSYKPVIEYGALKGYTNDMSVQSDIDNWTDVTGHNISPTPPVPPPTPGYDDDPWSGVSFSGVDVGGIGAFARCYYMTSTELANLRSWMASTNVPEGFNPMAQIIGLSQLPVALSGDAPENVQFINSSAVYSPGASRVVDSGVATQYSMGSPKKYSLGSVDITRRMQERGEPYLDYSCQIELYLPLIGVFSLDTQAVMGKTIEAEAVLDPISGTLAAYAYVTRDGEKLPIAYGSTTIAVDLPITAQQYSMSKAALKQANAQLYSSLLSGALTTIAAASAAGKASASGAGRSATASSGLTPQNSFTQSASIAGSHAMVSQTGNVFGSFMEWGRTIRQLSYGNNTAIAGSFGGSVAQWSYPFTAYVKIIRPRFEKPANYAHSQGVPCIQTKRIGDCTGFMQCVGVDVSSITRATDLERQAIQAALTNGIFAGGGQS